MLSNLEINDQTILAYIRTRECVELSNKQGYSLSFTGYSFGAWLAEQSVFFCHKEFKKRDVRAVTFESPGSKEYLDILNKSNIYSRETNFDLKDLDIVTYLTEPNFVNTCNSHVGKVYRFYLNSEKEDEKETIDFMEKQVIAGIKNKTIMEKIKDWFNSKIKSNLKPYLFYLNGLKSLFSNGLSSILLQFDSVSERPKKYHRVLKWPKVSFNPSPDMKDNYKKLIDLSKLLDMTPGVSMVPTFLKEKIAFVLNSGAKAVVGLVVDNCLNGLACIVNLLLEIFNGNMNHEQCKNCYKENKKMLNYKKNGSDESELNLKSYDFQEDLFSLSFQGVYQVVQVDLRSEERIILPNTTLDYMRQLYNRVELVLKKLPKLSNPLEKDYIELSSLYEIQTIKSGVENSSQFRINTLVEGLELEKLKWYMYYLIFDENKLKLKDYLEKISAGGGVVSIALDTFRLDPILDNRVIPFIGRTQILDRIREEMKTKQMVVLAAYGGTGKSTLANEFGYQYVANNKDRVSILLHCATRRKVHDDLSEIARSLKIKISKEIASKLFFHVKVKLNELGQSFLFILDNVEKYEDIKEFLKEFCLLNSEKCKFLMTTRDKDILYNKDFQNDKICIIPIDSFNSDEAKEYVQKNLEKYVQNDDEIKDVISVATFENKVLPYKLKLTVKYIEDTFSKYSCLNDCVKYIRTQSFAGTYLFKELSKTKSLSILAFCSYLDADKISLNLMQGMFKDFTDELINKLISLGMLDVDYKKRKIIMHRLLQSEMRSFIRKNPNEFLEDSKDEWTILNNLIKQLNSSLTKIDNSMMNNGTKLSEKIDLEYHQVKAILHYIDSKSIEKTSTSITDDLKVDFRSNGDYIKLKKKLGVYNLILVSNQLKALQINDEDNTMNSMRRVFLESLEVISSNFEI
jgi:hypothetical protein